MSVRVNLYYLCKEREREREIAKVLFGRVKFITAKKKVKMIKKAKLANALLNKY